MLEIQPAVSTILLKQVFNLIGTIDVDSIAALETLYVLPEGCTVELDFSLVQRVNSMGLAQLLKLFEHWQKRDTQIHVSNTNRMIGVLFKMTGLTRFLAAEPVAESAVEAPSYKLGSVFNLLLNFSNSFTKFISVNKQSNNSIVHFFGFRKTNCFSC
jgi:anti-anti-sigma regulatory factor